jgi:hypothetical protein
VLSQIVRERPKSHKSSGCDWWTSTTPAVPLPTSTPFRLVPSVAPLERTLIGMG